MYKINFIRPFTSLVLSLLFIISNTPKQLMHDLFANHIDAGKSESASSDKNDVHTATFHCQCDNLVAESPFIPTVAYSHCADYSFNYIAFGLSSYFFTSSNFPCYFSLRGPPSA